MKNNSYYLDLLDIIDLSKENFIKNINTILQKITNIFNADHSRFTKCEETNNKYLCNNVKFIERNNQTDSQIKSIISAPIFFKDSTFGILEILYKKEKKFNEQDKELIKRIVKILSEAHSPISETEEKFLGSFVLMMEARDVYTKGHSQRVAFYAKKIAEALNLSKDEQFKIYIAGMVHDIGKIGIPDAVLLKPGKLSEKECEIMNHHPEFSYQIIKSIEKFRDIAPMIRYHHERFDGKGYPKGLKGKKIPLGARILAIADVFDAITTNRPYRDSLNTDEAIKTMIGMESQFDKEILYKAIPILKRNFIKDTDKRYRNFMPKHIDKIRADMFKKDYMTGLIRRKTFMEKVNISIKKAENFSMIYVDIKDLSRINYRYSMDIGDKVIVYTADTLKTLKNIKFLARTQPDVFYFLYFGKIKPETLSTQLRHKLKDEVISRLSKTEMNFEGWHRVINFYVSFSEFIPGKSAEDMMYECQRRKKELEALLE